MPKGLTLKGNHFQHWRTEKEGNSARKYKNTNRTHHILWISYERTSCTDYLLVMRQCRIYQSLTKCKQGVLKHFETIWCYFQVWARISQQSRILNNINVSTWFDYIFRIDSMNSWDFFWFFAPLHILHYAWGQIYCRGVQSSSHSVLCVALVFIYVKQHRPCY